MLYIINNALSINLYTRPRGYKTFFMLNSVEHEILEAHKYNQSAAGAGGLGIIRGKK